MRSSQLAGQSCWRGSGSEGVAGFGSSLLRGGYLPAMESGAGGSARVKLATNKLRMATAVQSRTLGVIRCSGVAPAGRIGRASWSAPWMGGTPGKFPYPAIVTDRRAGRVLEALLKTPPPPPPPPGGGGG